MQKYIKILSIILITSFLFSSCGQSKKDKEKKDTGTEAVERKEASASKEFLDFASRLHKESYESLFLEDKKIVDESMKDLKASEPQKTLNAQTLASAAGMMAATGQMPEEAVLAMITAAVEVAPQDPLVVNNFGAVLRLCDRLEDSIMVLTYARSLEPKAPLILTNLGNSYLEQDDDREAEKLYKEALSYNDQFAPAHQSLALVYMKRGLFGWALEELLKSAEYGCFIPSTRTAYESIKRNGAIPEAPFGHPAGSSESDATSKMSPDDLLEIPPFPQFNDIGAFLASYDAVVQWSTSLTSGLEGVMDFARLMDSSLRSGIGQNAAADGRIVLKRSYDNKLFALRCLSDYYLMRIEKKNEEYTARVERLDEKLGQDIVQIQEPNYEKILENGIEAIIKEIWGQDNQAEVNKMMEAANTIAKQVKNASELSFALWKTITENHYNYVKQMMEEYWLYSGEIMKEIYDEQAFQMATITRKSTVSTAFMPVVAPLEARMLVYSITPVYSFGASGHDKREPIPIKKAKIPEKKKDDCPFKNGNKLGFKLGIFNYTVDCESAELQIGQGLVASGKWNFKKKEASYFVGVGGSLSAGLGGMVGAELGGKLGYRFSYDTNGNLTDISQESGFEASANAGPLSISRGSEVVGGLLTAPSTEFSTTFGFGF